MRENYPTKSDHDCRVYLKISPQRLVAKAKELGLAKKRDTSTYSLIPIKRRKCIWFDEGSFGQYCMNCSAYVIGGTCDNNGKEVGALWQKRCFKGEA